MRTIKMMQRAKREGEWFMNYKASPIARWVYLNTNPCEVYVWEDGSTSLIMFGSEMEFSSKEALDEYLVQLEEMACEEEA